MPIKIKAKKKYGNGYEMLILSGITPNTKIATLEKKYNATLRQIDGEVVLIRKVK
jgi:hypothetical protein